MITLEEVIINRGNIEKIYKSNITLTLWRALNKSEKRSNPLYPDLTPRQLPNGDIREADVRVYKDAKSGKDFVKSEEGVGTSVVDKEGIFGHKNWDYVTIPKGTTIPKELVITKDHFMARKGCWHYSISPNYDMPVQDFLTALDCLAVNAGIRMKVTKHG